MSAAPRPGASSLARSALFAGWMFALAITMFIVCAPLLLAPRRSALVPVKQWARWSLAGLDRIVGLKVEVERGQLAPQGAALIAAKHQGMLDILVALTLFPDPCIVLKKELMWLPIFGWFAAKTGMIAVDRAAGSAAVRQMTAKARLAVAEGRQLVIYPEGTRRAPYAEPDYKPGIAALSRQLELACIPMATNSGLYWPPSGLIKHPGVATYRLLAPIPAGSSRAALMRALESEIEAASRVLADAATAQDRSDAARP